MRQREAPNPIRLWALTRGEPLDQREIGLELFQSGGQVVLFAQKVAYALLDVDEDAFAVAVSAVLGGEICHQKAAFAIVCQSFIEQRPRLQRVADPDLA